MSLQFNLFNDDIFSVYEKNNLKYSIVDLSDITFRGGIREAVHSWFRLTPSYSPELVRYFINLFNVDNKSLLLDPFLGKGTTLIEAQKKNIKSIGIEINPLLAEVSEKSLCWNYDINRLINEYEVLKKTITKYSGLIDKSSLEEFITANNIEIPKIHNPYRWWKKDVLKKLLFIKKLVLLIPQEISNPFWIALSVSCLDCANIHRNHPTISFDDNHTRDIRPYEDFFENMVRIINDLKDISQFNVFNKAKVILGDSTNVNKYLNSKKITHIITSPPYPNRFSYVHTTRPQLFFFDIIKDAKTATDIDMAAIGGTWGKATSNLQKKPIEINKEIQQIIKPLAKEIRSNSLLMSNYAINYFNMMHNHVKSLKGLLSNNFKGCYVVGNSRLMGIEVHTDVLLSKIFELEGFVIDDIKIFRKRGGKKSLYETAVCVSKKN